MKGVNMKLDLISQQCSFFKVESGLRNDNMLNWSFTTQPNEEAVMRRIKEDIPVGHHVKVWGYDILNNDFILVYNKPKLGAVK
jgi:hypothetical protein